MNKLLVLALSLTPSLVCARPQAVTQYEIPIYKQGKLVRTDKVTGRRSTVKRGVWFNGQWYPYDSWYQLVRKNKNHHR